MPSGFEVTCANRNLNGTIVRLGGAGWSLSHQEAIQRIIAHQIRLFINIGNETHDVGVRGEGNEAYLVLESNGKALNEIEGLMSC